MGCGTKVIIQHAEGYTRAFRVRCKSWGCPSCGPRRTARIRKRASSGAPTAFLTLTCNPNQYDSPGERARAMVDAWKKLHKRLKRKLKRDHVPFFAVIEKTQRGEPHLHVLLRMPYVEQKWISEQWQDLFNSPIVHIQHVKSAQQAASYVGKYLSKAPHKFLSLKRHWQSQDWILDKPEAKQAISWANAITSVINGDCILLAMAWRSEGREVLECTSEYVLVHGPPGVEPALLRAGRVL